MNHPLARMFRGGVVPLHIAILFFENPRNAYQAARLLSPTSLGGRLGLWEYRSDATAEDNLNNRYWRAYRTDCPWMKARAFAGKCRDPICYEHGTVYRDHWRVVAFLREKVNLP